MHWPLAVDAFVLQIKTELQKHYGVGKLDDVRIIKDKKTGVSRQFGFLRFPSLEESREFMQQNHPTVQLHPNSSNDSMTSKTLVRIAFSKEREERDRDRAPLEGEWNCPNCNILNYSRRVDCFRCKALKPDPTVAISLTQSIKIPQSRNIGDNDVSIDATPSQFLLFRGLEASVTEELLSKGASKLLKLDESSSNLNDAAGKTASVKVASTSSVANAGARPGSIRRVFLAKDKRTNDSWRYGFVELAAVKDAQDALARFNSMDKFTIASKAVMVSYIHAGVFVPVMTAVPDNQTFASINNPAVRLAYWDEDAYVSELVVSMEELSSKGEATSKKEGKVKKRKADVDPATNAKKVMPSTLQFWTNRHAELHGDNTNDQDGQAAQRNTSTTIKNENAPPTRSFADPVKNCCYLCSRQFKSAAEVNKHERLSALHQDNLNDASLVTKAIEKLKKAGVEMIANNDTDGAYRDRAKERRTAFNQPKQPGFKLPLKANSDPTVSATPQDADPAIAPVSMSKGASLLGKMGWTAGSGLGASGTGSTATIVTDLYMAGVGLGAEGGKVGDAIEEAARASRGDYKEFAERTRDKARERFEKLG